MFVVRNFHKSDFFTRKIKFLNPLKITSAICLIFAASIHHSKLPRSNYEKNVRIIYVVRNFEVI